MQLFLRSEGKRIGYYGLSVGLEFAESLLYVLGYINEYRTLPS